MRSNLAGLRTLVLPWGAPSGSPRIVINATPIPPELVAFYAAGAPAPVTGPETVVGLTIDHDGRGNYTYQALVIDSSATPITSLVLGAAVAGVVGEFQRVVLNPGLSYPNGAVRTLLNLNQLTLSTGNLSDDTITVFNTGVHNDVFGRHELNAAGAHYWGPGGASDTDTAMGRAGAGLLASAPILGLATASDPTSAETWTGLTLLNNFTNRGAGFPSLSYRLVPSPAHEVRLAGQIASGATVASGTQIATLPAGRRPATEIPIVVANANSFATLILIIQTSGAVKLFGTWVNGQVIDINGLIPLDL